MRVKKNLVKGIVLVCVLLVAGIPRYTVMAEEPISEECAVVDETIETLNVSGEHVKDIERIMLLKAIEFVPYIGAILFMFGVFVAVFSIRNKGNRRWGIKLAVTEAIIVYLIYISLVFLYDFMFQKEVVGLLVRPVNATVYENIYFNTLEKLQLDGQQFLLLEEGWQDDFVNASRRMYKSIAGLLSFASVGIGMLLLVVNKRERGFRRFALAGMCIAIPAALMVGYHFLKM